MAHQNSDSKTLIEEGTLNIENVRYKYIIQLVNLKIRISFMIYRLSLCTWEKECTLEELKSLNPLFQLSEDEESLYQIFKNCLEKAASVKFHDKMMKLTISLDHISRNSSFEIQLSQSEINMDQFLKEYQIIKMLEYQDIQTNQNVNSILNKQQFPIKRKSEGIISKGFLFLFLGIMLTLLYLYVQSINDQFKKYEEKHQQEIDQFSHSVQMLSSDLKEQHKKQEDILSNNAEEINQMMVSIKRLLSPQYQKQLQDIEKIDSKIISPFEIKMIEYWNDPRIKKTKFDLLYRATRDGFQIGKLYEKCANRSDVLLLIKSSLNRRFGFYSDKEIKNYNGPYPSYPNKVYLFSLDTFTKYSSNQENCPYALFGSDLGIGVGRGDLFLHSNSNSNTISYNQPYSYGAQEGIRNNTLSGSNNFSTLEIEVHQLTFE